MQVINRSWIAEGIKHIKENKAAYQPGYRRRLSKYGKAVIFNKCHNKFKSYGQDYSKTRGLTYYNDTLEDLFWLTEIDHTMAYEYIKLSNGSFINYRTFCNLALGSFAWFYQNKFAFTDNSIINFIDNLYGQNANSNINYILGSIVLGKNEFKEIDRFDAMSYAQAGHFVFAAQMQQNLKGAGHVSLIIDGEFPDLQKGPNYEKALQYTEGSKRKIMPVCWNVGAEKRFGVQYLTYAFASGYEGNDHLSEIMFFVHDYKL
jgi:hypothetical protein